jgi:hypothetical protein
MPLTETTQTEPVIEGVADSVVAQGSSTAPTAGTAIATIAAPGAGIYRVVVQLRLSGTAETATANVELRHGATVVGKCGFTVLTDLQSIVFERVTVAAAEAITVNATANAVASSVYNARVIATQLA